MHFAVSPNNRVLGLIGDLAIASFGIGGLVYVVTDADARSIAQSTARLGDIRATTATLALELAREETAVDEYVLTADPRAHRNYESAVEQGAAALATLRTLAAALPGIDAAVVELDAAGADWRSRVAVPAMTAIAAEDELAIARFKADSIGDHAVIDAANAAVDREVAVAADVVASRIEGVDAVKTAGIDVAFGFLAVAFGVALVAVRRFGRTLEREARQASVLNRFTEVTSFASDDREVATSNLAALGRLVAPDASVTHILNRSQDRAVPEATTGDAIAEVLPLRALSRCAGVLRGTMYVTDDLADNLSVHCPIYPATQGTLACIPLISGESVGAVHLYWTKPNALPLRPRAGIARITEHAALAIGNRRLLAALHGQANTDARTGLSNSRSFDLALETALIGRSPDEAISVLMIDVDHFKQFNDRHGHPAGDEALKVFGAVLRSCMRDGDLAARYGGEEFAVILPGIGTAQASAIADRIRARTEATVISLAPGITDRITISIGVATAPDQASDRVTLLRLADQALYQAKVAGRNQVATFSDEQTAADPARTRPSEAQLPSQMAERAPSRPKILKATSDG